jgi:anti-sigma factor RsiW
MNGEHTDVGAYSLGLLEQRDRQAFEAHLADCLSAPPSSPSFLAWRALLSAVEPAGPAAGPGDEVPVTDLIRRRVTAQRRRTRWLAALGAAASAVLIGGGVAVGVAATRQPAAAPASVAGGRHSAAAAGTGVTGTVGLVAKTWGTQVTLDL